MSTTRKSSSFLRRTRKNLINSISGIFSKKTQQRREDSPHYSPEIKRDDKIHIIEDYIPSFYPKLDTLKEKAIKNALKSKSKSNIHKSLNSHRLRRKFTHKSKSSSASKSK